MKTTSRFPTTSTSQPPCKPTAELDALDRLFCLGSMALPAHLRLWWPYIPGIRSDNDSNAAINAIESAGETGWNNMDFGDTEGVGCKRPNVRKLWCVGSYKKMIITDFLYSIVAGEILSERPVGGANKDDFDWCCVASFDKSWGGVGDGGEKGSCGNGEDLHGIWSWERWGFFWEGYFWIVCMRRLWVVCRG